MNISYKDINGNINKALYNDISKKDKKFKESIIDIDFGYYSQRGSPEKDELPVDIIDFPNLTKISFTYGYLYNIDILYKCFALLELKLCHNTIQSINYLPINLKKLHLYNGSSTNLINRVKYDYLPNKIEKLTLSIDKYKIDKLPVNLQICDLSIWNYNNVDNVPLNMKELVLFVHQKSQKHYIQLPIRIPLLIINGINYLN